MACWASWLTRLRRLLCWHVPPASVASTDCFGAACTQCISAAGISAATPCGAVCVDAGVALPTGLFVPSILCGAAYGRLVGVFVADLRPVTGSLSSIDEGTYALLGAASFLGGSAGLLASIITSRLQVPRDT